MNGPNEEWQQPQLPVPIKDGPDEEKQEKEKKNMNSQFIVATSRDDEKCHTVSNNYGMDVLAAATIMPPKSSMPSLTTTRTRILQTTAAIRTPIATQEENENTTAIATLHPQACPSSSSSSSLHAPTCVDNSGTWTFNVCSDLPSLKDPDDNMDDDDKTTTTTRIIKTTKTGPLVPETTTTTPNEDDNVKNIDAPKQPPQPQPFFWFPCNRHQWSNQKRQFLLFTRILLKYLYSRDRPRYDCVRQMLANLWQQQQQEQRQLRRQPQEQERQEQQRQHFGVVQERPPQRQDYSSSTSTSSNRKQQQHEQDALIRMLLQMHNRLQEVVTLEQWNMGRHYLEQWMIHRRRRLVLRQRRQEQQQQQIRRQRQRLIQEQRDMWQQLRRQEL